MAPTFVYGTGFEMGSTLAYEISNSSRVIVEGGGHAGSYRLNIHDGSGNWLRVPTTISGEIYIAVWANAYQVYNTDNVFKIWIQLGDATIVELRWRGSGNGFYSAYRNGALLASGTIDPGAVWHLIEIRINLHDTTGRFVTKLDGITDIDFTGDTLPGTDSNIDYVYLGGGDAFDDSHYDDLTFGTADWMGDIRYDYLLPTSDSSVQWTRSAGSNNYETVDERPPSDSDYNSETTDTEKDKYGMGDWSETGKTPEFTVAWVRARKDEAASHEIEIIIDDGTESIGSVESLTTGFKYYYRLDATKPSGGAWTNTALDALVAGMRAQIGV